MLDLLVEFVIGLFKRRRKTLRSGTTEFPQATDLIDHLLNEYIVEGQARADWADFRNADDDDRWVQVARNRPDSVVVNCRYPFTDPPDKLMASRRVVVPPGFALTRWKRGKYAEFRAPRLELPLLAQFIDTWFVRMLDCGPGCRLEGYIEE